MGKHTSTWKDCERRVAALLGGQRIGVTGRNDDSMPDVITPVFAVECKHGEKYAAQWVHELPEGWFTAPGIGTVYVVRLKNVPTLRLNANNAGRIIPSRKVPGWLKKAISQAKAGAEAHKRRPLAVIHAPRTNIGEAVCFTW